MKDQILKIAKVKNEAEFYRKFPTEEAFQKAHGKEFKKAKLGAAMVPKAQKGKGLNFDEFGAKRIDKEYGHDCAIAIANEEADRQAAKDQRKIDKRVDKINARVDARDAAEAARASANAINMRYSNIGDKLGGSDYKARKQAYNDFVKANPNFAKDPSYTGQLSPEERYTLLDNTVTNMRRDRSIPNSYRDRLTNKFNISDPSKIGVSEMSNYANAMGGADKFREWYDEGGPEIQGPNAIGPRMQMYGGETKKLNQLTNFTNDVDGIIPQAFGGIYVPGQGVPQTQMYSADNTGIPSNILSMGYGTAPATVGGTQVNPQQAPGFNLGSSGNIQLPNNFLSKGYTGIGSGKTPGTDWVGKLGGPAGIGGLAGQIYSGIQGEKSWKETKKKSDAARNISALTLTASRSRPKDQIRNQYLRPEDVQEDVEYPNKFGTTTNYLSRNGSVVRADNGMQVGGNLGEIQNTYAPNTLYDDLGFEPLNDPNQIKQYMHGGIRRAQNGVDGIGSFLSAFGGGNATGASGGSGDQVGGLGNLIGTGGDLISKAAPAGSAVAGIAGPLGSFVKFAINDQRKRHLANNALATKDNLQKAAFSSGVQNLQQGQYGNFMENGGWVSHDWQPQVITQFGEHSMKDLLKEDPEMDTLRTGGNIRQNNMYPQDRYALGGELKTLWGGKANTVSYNKFLDNGNPTDGESIEFEGNSHDKRDPKTGQTGIGVNFGDAADSYTDYAEYGTDAAVDKASVEVENEAAQKINDNLVVYGAKKWPKAFNDELKFPEIKGGTFNKRVKSLNKIEAKNNKIVEKATDGILNNEDYSSYGKLKDNANKIMEKGANMKLKDIAADKIAYSNIQSAINDTLEEHGLHTDVEYSDLQKGKLKYDKNKDNMAKFGKSIEKAQNGKVLPKVSPDDYERLKKLYEQAERTKKGSDVEKFQKEYYKVAPEYAEQIIRESEPSNLAKRKGYTKADLQNLDREKLFETNDDVFGDRTKKFFTAIKPTSSTTPPPFIVPDLPTGIPNRTTTTTIPQKPTSSGKTKYDWMDLVGAALPYFTPSDQEPFDYSQVYPEMMSLATNTLEPVKAQLYNPLLEQPYDISLQDQMNANQSDFNAIQRQQGYNPEALAILAAQKYAANSKVLGEQFRLNQEEKAGVYGRNRGTLNQSQLQNLGILDTNMVRRETAKSRTKEQAIEAMKSIADKIAKNKLENRTLGIYENLYNYRYDKNGRAVNVNPPVKFNGQVPGAYGTTGIPPTATNPYVSGSYSSTTPQAPLMPGVTINAPRPPYIPLPTLEELYQDEMVFPVDQQRKGGKTKKNNKNGNIVKAIKNL